jgi:glycosyltransferase involved in cell wall biosynthesis
MLESRSYVPVESGSIVRSIGDSSFSVIMPAYNEAEFIDKNVQETVRTLSELGYRFEVIVVDDGSLDDTHKCAFRARTVHPNHVRVVRYDENLGKGNALMCGCAYATGDYVVFLDADMDLHPEQLPVLFKTLESNKADVVVGSKHHPLSRVAYPPIRRFYSIAYYTLVRLLFGLPVRDTQTGLKVFRATVLRDVLPLLLVKRFAFDIELLANAHRRGYKVVDAPVTLNFRRALGRIRYRDVVAVLKDTLAIFYRLRILHYYDKVAERQQADLPGSVREIHAADT